jgi:hypothetical protein
MSGPPSTPPSAPPTQPAPVSGDNASLFLNALANDLIEARGGASVTAPLQGVVTNLLSNAAGAVQLDAAGRAAAADKLIQSFNTLGGRPLPQEMQTMIKDVFNDPSLTSAAAIAEKIRESSFTSQFVQLIADNNLNFGNVFDGGVMTMLQAFHPDLANFLQDLGLGRDNDNPSEERRIETSLADGWEAWQRGRVHEFNEIEGVDANGQPLPQSALNNWTAPNTEHDKNEFFEAGGPTDYSRGLWGSDESFKFTDADPQGRPNTFAGMIVAKWEEDGVVEFTGTPDEIEAARAAFVAQSHALATGGALDSGFAQRFEDQNVITFSDPSARAAFVQHMSDWRSERGGEYRDAQEIMQEVIDYVNDNGGASWVNPKFDDETDTAFSTTQSEVYRIARQYDIAKTGEDYAREIQIFAEQHPHITIKAPPAPSQGGPSAQNGNPNATPPTPPPDPNEIKVTQFDKNETAGLMDYGDAITGDLDAATMTFKAEDGTEIFKFSDDFQVYGLNLAANGATGGHNITMNAMDMNGRTPQEVLASLGDDFKVSVVAHQDDGVDVADTELFGFYIESADGSTSFYVGPGAIEEGSVTDAGKEKLVEGIETAPESVTSQQGYDPNTDPNRTASIAQNSDGLTADGQQDNLNVFSP